jgi:integrase
MLNLAVDDGILETALKIKLDSEKKFARRRVVSDEEFEALLEQSPRYLQRVVIGLYETAMRSDELLKLTWNKVGERAGVIRLMPENTKEDA